MSVSLTGQTIKHLKEEKQDEYSVSTCEILLCEDFLRRNSDLIFLCASLTINTFPLVLQLPMLHDLPHLRSTQLFHGNSEIQGAHYEWALKLRASGIWEKQTASYHTS